MDVVGVVLISVATFAAGWVLSRWLAEDRPETMSDARSTTSSVSANKATGSRIEQGLGPVPLGVVLVDENGGEIFRNEAAAAFKTARHGDALVEAAIAEVIAQATSGRPVQRSVELWGPPAKSFDLTATPIIENRRCVGATVTIDDVTAANDVLRARKDLIDNVSHELRTPVGAMVSLSETLVKVEDPIVQKRLIGRVQTQAVRLGEIVDDLLMLSQVESSDSSGFEPVALGPIVAEVVEQLSDLAEGHDVSLIGLNHASEPPVVEGDRRQLMSVVSNLCDNAIKYSPAKSRVVITVDSDDQSAYVKVQDSGVGVPESEIDRIFERFYRLDSARSRSTGGTGLGLSIVRNALRVHKGSISVRSTEGKGSTFVAKLPLLSGGVAPQVGQAADRGENADT